MGTALKANAIYLRGGVERGGVQEKGIGVKEAEGRERGEVILADVTPSLTSIGETAYALMNHPACKTPQ